MSAGARRLFGWYQRQLSAAPLRTNIASTCAICVLGDAIAQRMERRSGSHGHVHAHAPEPLSAAPHRSESAGARQRRCPEQPPQQQQQQQQQAHAPPQQHVVESPGSGPDEAWGHDLSRSLRMIGWGLTGGGVPVILWCATAIDARAVPRRPRALLERPAGAESTHTHTHIHIHMPWHPRCGDARPAPSQARAWRP